MGQFHLNILTLTVILVGAVSFFGIRWYSADLTQQHADAMLQDMTRMALDAQRWKQTPPDFGGQPTSTEAQQSLKDDDANFSWITFQALGYTQETHYYYENEHAVYRLRPGKPLVIEGLNAKHNLYIQLEVRGLGDDDIVQTTLELGTSTKEDL